MFFPQKQKHEAFLAFVGQGSLNFPGKIFCRGLNSAQGCIKEIVLIEM
jgi:hypothetical protein